MGGEKGKEIVVGKAIVRLGVTVLRKCLCNGLWFMVDW